MKGISDSSGNRVNAGDTVRLEDVCGANAYHVIKDISRGESSKQAIVTFEDGSSVTVADDEDLRWILSGWHRQDVAEDGTMTDTIKPSIFVKSGSHRAADKVKRVGVPLRWHYRGMEGGKFLVMTEKEWEQCKGITGLTKCRNQNPKDYGECWSGGVK